MGLLAEKILSVDYTPVIDQLAGAQCEAGSCRCGVHASKELNSSIAPLSFCEPMTQPTTWVESFPVAACWKAWAG